MHPSRLFFGGALFGPLRCGGRGWKKWSRFFSSFETHFGPSLGPKIASKFVNFWVQLRTFFVGVLELFGCLLGAFLGLVRLSWEASRVKKCRQSHAKTTFLLIQVFGSMKILMALLGSSWSLLGRSGPKMGPKIVTKSFPKNYQKIKT